VSRGSCTRLRNRRPSSCALSIVRRTSIALLGEPTGDESERSRLGVRRMAALKGLPMSEERVRARPGARPGKGNEALTVNPGGKSR
jgi:hypothetical protein